MAFIRKKRIKAKSGNIFEYAYIVENIWKKRGKGSRQKVKGYLGKIYVFKRIKEDDFCSFFSIADINQYVKNSTKEKILNDVIKLELYNHGFSEKDDMLFNNKIYFDLNNKEFYIEEGEKVKKKMVLALNDGFLCKENIVKLLNFKIGYDEDKAGYNLAKAFVECGLKVPKDVFVGYFERLGR